MTDINPDTTPGNQPDQLDEDTVTREAAGQEPRSFGGEDQGEGPDVSYGDPASGETEQRADARPANDDPEAEIAADDAGASAMAERAGRDIEQDGR